MCVSFLLLLTLLGAASTKEVQHNLAERVLTKDVVVRHEQQVALIHRFFASCVQGRMWWCFGCYFCLPVLFTILCQMATRNVNSDSSSAHKQRSHDDRSSSHKRQQHQVVERQLNCTLLALAVVYGVCALPEHVCNITLAYTHITVSEDTAAMLVLLHHFLLFFKCSVTPVLLLCLCKVSQEHLVLHHLPVSQTVCSAHVANP